MFKFQQTVFFVLFFASNLEADLHNYFKLAEGKTNAHFNQVRNIDFIYMINLDQRPEKWIHCLDELTPYHIYPYRFSAVNGWELSLQELNQLGVKYLEKFGKTLWGTAYLPERNFEPYHESMHVVDRTYFCHCMSRGAIGIVLSHLSILQDAYNAGYQTIWVMEDDIEVIQNPILFQI
jgi:GR25 family glycosyltransferase involved in LPS biosynthesis